MRRYELEIYTRGMASGLVPLFGIVHGGDRDHRDKFGSCVVPPLSVVYWADRAGVYRRCGGSAIAGNKWSGGMTIMNDEIYKEWLERLPGVIKDCMRQQFIGQKFNIALPRSAHAYYGMDFAGDAPNVSSISYVTLNLKDFTYSTTPANVPTDEEVRKGIQDVLNHFKYLPEEKATYFEADRDGNLYGYKVLVDDGDGVLKSPNYLLRKNYPDVSFSWDDGKLSSQRSPTRQMPYGIHGVKKLKHLEDWYRKYERGWRHNLVVVRIVIWGTIVETEFGFRAEHAKIVDVVEHNWEQRNGYW